MAGQSDNVQVQRMNPQYFNSVSMSPRIGKVVLPGRIWTDDVDGRTAKRRIVMK